MGQIKYKKPGASKFEEFSGNKPKVKEPSTPTPSSKSTSKSKK
jgi:hypothetical protein|tara:strand:+ start:1519 stop:1647 length:129 start_codon:yes stop_codon:yes gene_type:complete